MEAHNPLDFYQTSSKTFLSEMKPSHLVSLRTKNFEDLENI